MYETLIENPLTLLDGFAYNDVDIKRVPKVTVAVGEKAERVISAYSNGPAVNIHNRDTNEWMDKK